MFNKFKRTFLRIDKNLQVGKGSKRKIGMVGNSYRITIPPSIVHEIFNDYNTEYLELYVDEIKGKKFISLFPCDNDKENIS